MIAALLLFLQVADSATAVVVREGERATAVPIVFTRAGRLVRGDQIAAPLGARLTRVDRERFTIEAGGAKMDFTLQLSAVRVGKEVLQLAAAPVEREGRLYVPLGAFTEILPRFAAGYAFDARRGEIRRFVASLTVAPARARSAGRMTPADSLVAAAPAPPPVRPVTVQRKAPVIVIDAGHGGPDRGMRGPMGARRPIQEADITLAVAKRVRDVLRARGVRVVMTRSTDTLIALADRGRLANKAGADLFVSIHVNAANPRWPNPRGARGVETYFLSDAKTEDEKRVEEMENDAVKYDLDVDAAPGDPLSYLLSDMRENEYLRESSELATHIQRELVSTRPNGEDRGVKQAGFRVLVTAHMPAVLVEIGFGTNGAEMQHLNSAAGQQSIAGSIARATMAYFEQYEQRRSGARVGMP